MELTEREVELLRGMREVQLDHANRCDRMANIKMSERQKGYDLERARLIGKILVSSNIEKIIKAM